MSRLADSIREARIEMEKFGLSAAKANAALAGDNGSGVGGGGGASPGGTASAPGPPITITLNNQFRTITTGDPINRAGQILAGEGVDGFLKFLRQKGIYDPAKVHAQTIAALRLEFDRLIAKMNAGLGGRTGLIG